MSPQKFNKQKHMPPTSTHFYYIVGCLDQPFGTLKGFLILRGLKLGDLLGSPGNQRRPTPAGWPRPPSIFGKESSTLGIGESTGLGWAVGGLGFWVCRKMTSVSADCCFVNVTSMETRVWVLYTVFFWHQATKQHSDIKLCSCIVDNKPSKVQKTMTWSYMVKQCLF